MADREPARWITIKGKHLPIYEDGSIGIGQENEPIPTRDDIIYGEASYGNMPVKYHKEIHADAMNMDTEIWVSDKFFEHNKELQQHILNHELAHNISDEMMKEQAGNWQAFTSIFIQEKPVPKTAPAYKQGQRTYWEGLYGDIGSKAIAETTTRAITEFLDDPNKLKSRSLEAYNFVKSFMQRRK